LKYHHQSKYLIFVQNELLFCFQLKIDLHS
jgi:hypothetical protein